MKRAISITLTVLTVWSFKYYTHHNRSYVKDTSRPQFSIAFSFPLWRIFYE